VASSTTSDIAPPRWNSTAEVQEDRIRDAYSINQAVFDRIEVCDRKLASVRYQAPFDLLFSTSKFEYDAVVAPTYPYANRVPLVTGPTIRLAAPRIRAGADG
jgi:hypothetical protein